MEDSNLYCGALIPLVWTSRDVFSGSQSQSGHPYSCLVEAKALHIPSNLLITPAKLFTASHSPHACFSRGSSNERPRISVSRATTATRSSRSFFVLQEKPKTVNKNKLSSRRRCIPTPDEEVLEGREEGYIIDAIRAERRRTKFKDTLLVPYNALRDPMCQDYFQRKDIQLLLTRTTPPVSSMTSSSWTPVSLPRIYTSDANMVSLYI